MGSITSKSSGDRRSVCDLAVLDAPLLQAHGPGPVKPPGIVHRYRIDRAKEGKGVSCFVSCSAMGQESVAVVSGCICIVADGAIGGETQASAAATSDDIISLR